MVLQGGPCGRVGHRRTSFVKWPPKVGWPFLVNAHERKLRWPKKSDPGERANPATLRRLVVLVKAVLRAMARASRTSAVMVTVTGSRTRSVTMTGSRTRSVTMTGSRTRSVTMTGSRTRSVTATSRMSDVMASVSRTSSVTVTSRTPSVMASVSRTPSGTATSRTSAVMATVSRTSSVTGTSRTPSATVRASHGRAAPTGDLAQVHVMSDVALVRLKMTSAAVSEARRSLKM